MTPFVGELCVASWNVEGLSEIKLWELTEVMSRYSISILCIQETHIAKSPYYTTENGFLVILTGSTGIGRDYAGVGFIVAPWAKHAVACFLQLNSRLACLKFRVAGGKLGIISAYAPHNGHPFDARQEFFEKLGSMYERTAVNKGKFIFGDLNSRLHTRLPGEEAYIGDYVFGDPSANLGLSSNRELLLELCASYDLTVSNTFFSKPWEKQVTFRCPGTAPLEHISWNRFTQLDFVLATEDNRKAIQNLGSCRQAALASHHYLLVAKLAMETVIVPPQARSMIDRSLLKDKSVASSFADGFHRFLDAKTTIRASPDVNDVASTITQAFETASSVLEVSTVG